MQTIWGGFYHVLDIIGPLLGIMDLLLGAEG